MRKLVLLRAHLLSATAALLVPSALAAQGGTPRASPLPAVPAVSGPLVPRVVYPRPEARVMALDSTFLFGSLGNGRASLAINGHDVPVAPNGAFLAWLPIPPATDSVTVFRLVARLDGDSALLEHRVRVPELVVNPDTGLWIDRGSIAPAGAIWAEPGETMQASVTASPNAAVAIHLPGGQVVQLVPTAVRRERGGPFERTPREPATETRYVGSFPAVRVGLDLGSPGSASFPPAEWDSSGGATMVVASERGTLRVPMPLRLGLVDPARRPVVVLDDDTARTGATDGAVSGSPSPGGTYHWFFRNGTRAAVSGRVGRSIRLQLSDNSVAWTDVSNVSEALPEGTPPPRARLALVRLVPGERSVAARFALGARIPYRVDEDGRRLSVTLYGAVADADFLQYGGTDPLVPLVSWAQHTEDECTVTFVLSSPVFGYRALWDGDDLVLEIRRPPPIDRDRPLRGRTIAVDPGHPPQGATGPTGLLEHEANLAVASALRRLLERAGARVVMTRDSDTAVGLYERVNLAEAEDAEILVSVHNNAFPDGVNPFVNNGTSTYYFHPRSARLATLVQRGMVARLGLRDLGIGRGDLALVRPTWMPAVLTEGAFLMIPEQENALRSPSFQERYARGVLRGIEAYLRELRAGR